MPDREAFVREAAHKQQAYARDRKRYYETVVQPIILARNNPTK